MSDEEALVSRAYTAYNGQDVDGLFALVSDDDVYWAYGSKRMRGKAAVRAYSEARSWSLDTRRSEVGVTPRYRFCPGLLARLA